MTTSYFTSPEGRRLAYRATAPSRSGLTFVWLSGFKSDMSGTKATELESWAIEAGHGFLGFDYSGHGESDGAFENGTISDWRADALAAIDAHSAGPVVLVGSSMGGWMALLSALARKDRVAGLVLIAPAPDFTEKLMWPEFSAEAQAEIMEKGFTLRPSDYDEPYTITMKLIEDGRDHLVMREKMPISVPVRLLHGMCDESVPYELSLRIAGNVESEDVQIRFVKDGDHRLSTDRDLEILSQTVAALCDAAG